MNYIKLANIKIENSKVIYQYEVHGIIKKYFKNIREFYIDYNIDVSNVPKSILAIPFITNILPFSWIYDAKIIVEEIDKDFFESIEDIKKGYISMYKKVSFNGAFECKKIINNKYKIKNTVGAFYSGGLDATSTLATHYNEKPILINLQGSDISLLYKDVSKGVKKFLKQNADNLNLKIHFIESEFRRILKEKVINKYTIKLINDNYWHGFQHGIAIIGHAAPLAYIYGFKTVYIASSFTKEDNVKCASDPTIDNFVKLSKTQVFHDGYEYNRNDKSENVGNFIKKYNFNIQLRVCLDDYIVNNCSHCEKCYRTIYGFAAKGYDPSIVGFNLTNKDYFDIQNDIRKRIIIEFIPYWINIQNEFLKRPELKKDDRFSWIYDYDFKKGNSKFNKKILKIYGKYKRRIMKLFKLIFKKED